MTIFFLLFSSCTSGDTLSKKEMFLDYDSLVDLIHDINPQIEVRREATDYDIVEELNILRNGIDTCSSDYSFYLLINKALNLCQDLHAGILPMYYFDNPTLITRSMIRKPSNESISITKKFRSKMDSIVKLRRVGKLFRYSEGNYYLRDSLTIIASNAQLVKINDIKTDTFIEQLKNQQVLRWDFYNNKFYHEDFLMSYELISKRFVSLTFLDNGIIKDLTLDLWNEYTKPKTLPRKMVRFLDDDSSLYIRVPVMILGDTSYFQNEILKYSNKEINRVIIDIRNNPGGHDWFSKRLLSMLIMNPIETNVHMVSNTSPLMLEYMDKKEGYYIQEKISWLDDKPVFSIYKTVDVITPSSKSLNYEGDIILVQDENIFSAAYTLTSYAHSSDQLILVGKETGLLMGRGIAPIVFELPNSHLLIRLEPILDISNCKKPSDVYHQFIEDETYKLRGIEEIPHH